MKKAVVIAGAIIGLPFLILGMGLGFFWTVFAVGFRTPHKAAKDAGF